MIFHLNLFLSRQKTTTKKSLMWNTMFIGPFMVCEIFAYKLYENYVKELKIKAKTNKLFKIPLVFYSPRQRVSWTSEADPQYFIPRGRGFPGALRLIPSTLLPEAEGFLELWGWPPVLIPRGRGFPGALRLIPSALRAAYLSQALSYPPLIHLQRKLRQPTCNQSFFLPVYDHLEKDGTASKSPSLIHILPRNFQTWPRVQ